MNGPVVIMGVAGCGKSSFAAALTHALGWALIEGDEFHPPENVAKMRAGIALTDDDRAGWLSVLADELMRRGPHAVLTCSALKKAYRDRLRAGDPRVLFVHLDGSQSLIAGRIAARTHLYMPASLLESQFAALQLPEPDEHALTLSVELPPAVTTAQ